MFKEILKECIEINNIIKTQQNLLEEKINIIKENLPKGYWYSCDITEDYSAPEKYKVHEVSFCSGEIYVTARRIRKKYESKYNENKYLYTLDEFIKLTICKTEKEAEKAAYNRICPKCGGLMKYANTTWCSNCMDKRAKTRRKFIEEHTFYYPKEKMIYRVDYVDELTRQCDKGYNGAHFTIQRLDTMEIIHTDNLWSTCSTYGIDDVSTLPQIEFLETTCKYFKI